MAYIRSLEPPNASESCHGASGALAALISVFYRYHNCHDPYSTINLQVYCAFVSSPKKKRGGDNRRTRGAENLRHPQPNLPLTCNRKIFTYPIHAATILLRWGIDYFTNPI